MIRFREFIIRYCEFGGRKAKYINKAKRTQKETQNETKKRTPTAQKNNYTKSLEFSKEKYSLGWTAI